MKINEVDKSKLSPMMLKYVELKEANSDLIIFYRLGDFYEMFFEDAIICSKVLELTLTGKSAGLLERVPMCGIPYHAYLGYANKLVDLGYKVGICEQLNDPKTAVGLVERGLIQILTSGTRLDIDLNTKDNNYIASIYDLGYAYVISYTDISTGYFYAKNLDNYEQEEIYKIVTKFNIKEIIVNFKIDRNIINYLRENLKILVTIKDELYEEDDYSYIYSDILDIRIITCIKHLLSYLLETKKGNLKHLQKVEVEVNKYLEFDNATKRNLELIENLRLREKKYSLFWLLDKTKTAFGGRLLKYNIENPLTDKTEINRRYNIVELLLNDFITKEELSNLLDSIYDLERLMARINYSNLNARDLICLKNSLKVLPNIDKLLNNINYDKKIDIFTDLYEILDKSINEDSPLTIKEGGFIKDGYNSDLDELRSVRSGSKDFITKLETEEKIRTGIKNLKVGYNKVFGYFIEISKGSVKDIKEDFGYIRKQTLSNCERFVNSVLKEKEDIILNAEDKINKLEYDLFMEIREKVSTYTTSIQKTAKILAEVDMLVAFATVSSDNNYIKPNIVKEHIIDIKESRHPVLEITLKDNYIRNDIIMNKNTNILLITGPNMAGKSTYIRQLAIIVIMAQIGCYVPASSCNMPIFDKIFTRIGASDDLVSGESTFMVEMKEANNALSNATKDSLILFDELGRGTATYDGMAIAQSILEYIHDFIHAKTLFSTHYHELTSLDKDLVNLKNIHVSAIEEEGKITFLHKIKNGPVDKSYGIHVANLANLPPSLIKRAGEILNVYENDSIKQHEFTQTSLFLNTEEKLEEKDLVKEKLKEIDPLQITPIEALNLIYELKQIK